MTLITGCVVAILAAVLPLTDLLTLVNIGTLAAFAIVCGGVLLLRMTDASAIRPFRAPLLPVIAIAGAVACFYLITGLQAATWIRYAAWLSIGIVIYAFYGYRQSRLRKI